MYVQVDSHLNKVTQNTILDNFIICFAQIDDIMMLKKNQKIKRFFKSILFYVIM